MILNKFFTWLMGNIGKGLKLAHVNGLDDLLVTLALTWVKEAATKFANSSERRVYVIKMLVNEGVPESVARIAVELAYLVFKAEVAKNATADHSS